MGFHYIHGQVNANQLLFRTVSSFTIGPIPIFFVVDAKQDLFLLKISSLATQQSALPSKTVKFVLIHPSVRSVA